MQRGATREERSVAYLADGEWYCARSGDELVIQRLASGQQVALPLDLFDAVVMMRAAQLSSSDEDGMVDAAIQRACDLGTLGGEALRARLLLPSIIDVPDFGR